MAEIAYVSLGSNEGDRRAHLRAALAALEASAGIRDVVRSPIYETDAVGPGRQRSHLNAVARLSTTLSPRALLERLLAIEAENGRVRGPVRHMPRTLDLDLLLYGDRMVDEPGLSVPHPALADRAFVLEPLCDLAPDHVHPVLGKTVAVLAARVRDPAAVRACEPRGGNMAIVAVSLSPVGTGQPGVSEYVAAALAVARSQDRVRFRTDPMFTTLEGDLDEIFALVRRMQEAVFEAGAVRVGTVMKIDDRRDKTVRMEDKVRAVEERSGS